MIQNLIYNTLCYSDIFDYPVSKYELYTFLISKRPISFKNIIRSIHELNGKISYNDGFFCLKEREMLIAKRKKRNRESRKKIVYAQRVAHVLSFIPTIRLIGLSGSVAMGNSKPSDDIDFFIITRLNFLWLTRLIVVGILSILRVRRSHATKNTQNLICTNLFLSENTLAIPLSQRNLYMAHEVAYVLPLINKKQTYELFLKKNKWITAFLPNFPIPNNRMRRMKSYKTGLISLQFLYSFLNTLLFVIQYYYMKRRKTQEIVEKDRAFFHPHDYKDDTLNQYYRKLSEGLIRRKSKKIGSIKSNAQINYRPTYNPEFTPGS